MISLPQPCPQCAAPIMNYSAWCAECGYKPSAPKSPAYLAGYTAALKDAAKVVRDAAANCCDTEQPYATASCCAVVLSLRILALSPVEPSTSETSELKVAPVAWRITWLPGSPNSTGRPGITDSKELADARFLQGAFVAPLYDAAALASLTAALDAWIETARMHHGNEEFYRGLVHKIGEPFGIAARTSDDGSVQDDILALKVPELVATLRARLVKAKEGLGPFAKAAIAWEDEPDNGKWLDIAPLSYDATVGDLRRAASLLSEIEKIVP